MTEPTAQEPETAPVRFPLDRSKLAELARAFHDQDPAWYDEAAASAAGFHGVPAPPTVGVLADHWRKDGLLAFATIAGLDVERVLHGEVAWEYLRPLRMGDELTATSTVSDIAKREGRRGGTMTLVTVETDFVDQRGELALRRRDVLIEREAGA